MQSTQQAVGSVKKAIKPNNIITVPTQLDLDFFKWWCVFLRPFAPLTNREVDVIAGFLLQRHELSKIISDESVLDDQLMSNSVRDKVIKECGITLQHYYVIISNLKKHKVITEDNKINRRLIPNIRMDDNGVFQLLVLFKDPKK